MLIYTYWSNNIHFTNVSQATFHHTQMPILGRWDENADDGQARPVQKRAGVWRYDDDDEQEPSPSSSASSSSGYLDCTMCFEGIVFETPTYPNAKQPGLFSLPSKG